MSTLQKRFYKTVTVSTASPFAVSLDDRKLKTPAGNPQEVPTRALAEAMAEEWRQQGEKLDLPSMVLTRAVNTVIDRIVPRRIEVLDELSRYAGSDLVCYRAEAPRELIARQEAGWNPWVDWAARELGVRLRIASGIVHVEQDVAVTKAMYAAMDRLDSFRLSALHPAVTITGSAVLGLAFALRLITPAEVLGTSCVDEDYQAERWGRDAEAEAVRKNRLSELEQARKLLDLLEG